MNTNRSITLSLEHAKVRWRGRRGLKELDLLLLPFIEQKYLSLPLTQRQVLTEMLESPDPDLYNWILGYTCPINHKWQHLCELIRAFNQSQH
jgi:antitoxin CptB